MRRLLYIPLFLIALAVQSRTGFGALYVFIIVVSAMDFKFGIFLSVLGGLFLMSAGGSYLIIVISLVSGILFYKLISPSYAWIVSSILIYAITLDVFCALTAIPLCFIMRRVAYV